MGYVLQNQFNTPLYQNYLASLKRTSSVRGRPRKQNKIVYVRTGYEENWILSVGGHGPIDDSGPWIRYAKLISDRQVARSISIASRLRESIKVRDAGSVPVRYVEEYDNG